MAVFFSVAKLGDNKLAIKDILHICLSDCPTIIISGVVRIVNRYVHVPLVLWFFVQSKRRTTSPTSMEFLINMYNRGGKFCDADRGDWVLNNPNDFVADPNI